MSEAEPAAVGSALSFEQAEFENPAPIALVCGYCGKALSVQYWEISKRPACESCRAVVQRELAGSSSQRHLLRAVGFGLGAAIAGSVVWELIEKLFHAQVGIVAIGIGYVVGRAVRKGASGFGGRRYQVLAVLLTYSSIALASLPGVIELSPAGASVPYLIGLSFVSPFLGGTENVIGWFIIAIGLYQAWKLTRALPIQVLGPFSLAPVKPIIDTHAAD
ncbi:MAG: hypothetical protein ABIQ16_25905 [Polyangiaceae bacterium]